MLHKMPIFDHKVNIYSKHMVAMLHVPVYHVIRCKIILSVFYMHDFTSLTFLTYSAQCFSQNARVYV
jgi:hypothetical protein